MKTILFLQVLVLSTSIGFSTTWTIANSGNSFSPATITITVGDDVIFSLESVHNAVEVSQETWNAGGTTPIAGGFQVGFGGGQVNSAQLGIGTHYYVCVPHASSGMKGTIIVQNVTRVEEGFLHSGISVYPNPTYGSLKVEATEGDTGTEFYITDLRGRKIVSGKLENDITFIDLSYLIQGTYLIGIASEKRRPVKLIKY